MHAESGFWRPKPDGTIEVVIAQSTGLVEVQVPPLDFFGASLISFGKFEAKLLGTNSTIHVSNDYIK